VIAKVLLAVRDIKESSERKRNKSRSYGQVSHLSLRRPASVGDNYPSSRQEQFPIPGGAAFHEMGERSLGAKTRQKWL